MVFPGFAESELANHEGHSTSGYVGGGKMYKNGDWDWGPTLSLQYTNMEMDSFTETGGAAALAVAGRNVDSLRSQLGVRATRRYETSSGCSVVPDVRLRWAHEFSNNDQTINAAFAGAALTPFSSFSRGPDRDTAYLGASVSAYFNKSMDAFVSYDADLGRSGSTLHAGRAGLAVKF